MKDVWVKKDLFGSYEPITEQKAKNEIKDGYAVCVDIRNENVNGETWTVHLVIRALMGYCDDEMIQEAAEAYLNYVMAITGIDRRA